MKIYGVMEIFFKFYQIFCSLKEVVGIEKAKQSKELEKQGDVSHAEVTPQESVRTSRNKYVDVDFYDGSIIYDFKNDLTTLCDIDFFRKEPVINDRGEDWFGTKRLKAPEENTLGAVIDEVTNIYTLRALIFDFFGIYSDEDIRKRCVNNCFYPC